jgi:hypothetical protein
MKTLLVLLMILFSAGTAAATIGHGEEEAHGEHAEDAHSRLSKEELREIEGTYAVNLPHLRGYWLAAAFTALTGAAALWAWTRR